MWMWECDFCDWIFFNPNGNNSSHRIASFPIPSNPATKSHPHIHFLETNINNSSSTRSQLIYLYWFLTPPPPHQFQLRGGRVFVFGFSSWRRMFERGEGSDVRSCLIRDWSIGLSLRLQIPRYLVSEIEGGLFTSYLPTESAQGYNRPFSPILNSWMRFNK